LPSIQGFQNLVSMNLSVNAKNSKDNYAHLQACLEASRNVRHLALELSDYFHYDTLQLKLLRIDDDGKNSMVPIEFDLTFQSLLPWKVWTTAPLPHQG
jgi:hypothetical protein